MTDKTKADVIEIYDAAKDKKEQVRLMVEMGFGTRAQIINALHEAGRAMEFKTSGRKAKPQNDKTPEPEEDKKQPERLPMPQDVKQLLIDELEGIDASIKELEEIIQDREIEKRKLETLYQHIVECVSF